MSFLRGPKRDSWKQNKKIYSRFWILRPLTVNVPALLLHFWPKLWDRCSIFNNVPIPFNFNIKKETAFILVVHQDPDAKTGSRLNWYYPDLNPYRISWLFGFIAIFNLKLNVKLSGSCCYSVIVFFTNVPQWKKCFLLNGLSGLMSSYLFLDHFSWRLPIFLRVFVFFALFWNRLACFSCCETVSKHQN
jgi:hypothetical protein